jgi:hypothetical protein
VEQREFVEFFRQKWPKVRIFAIPNGGSRTPSQAARLKAEGVSAGVPDLFIPEWKLWIEMKRKKDGRVSEAQSGWIGYLEDLNMGYRVFVCHGCDDAIEQVVRFSDAKDD